MAGNMELGAGALKQIGGEVTSGKEDFRALSHQLSGKINEKTQQWQGAGGTAFFNLHQQWQDKNTKILAALDEFDAALRKTDSDTTSTDQGQSQSMGTNLGALDAIPNY